MKVSLFADKEPDTGCRFPNLAILKVVGCVRIRHICMSSMENYIGEIQKLYIYDCTEFEAIVTEKSGQHRDNEDGVPQVLLLAKLNVLRLRGLKNLSTIVPKGYTLKWSSLKNLEVSETGDNMLIQTGHGQMLSGLQSITIRGMESLKVLSSSIPGGFSFEVRDMSILVNDQVSYVFSPSLIRTYNQLERVKIKDLDSMVVFNLEEECSAGGEPEIAALNKLDVIYIEGLYDMMHVWWKVPWNFEGFHNLTILILSACNKLKYLCSPSIANCLVNLRDISVRDCDMIEEIISTANEEREKEVQKRSDNIVFFPRIQSISLICLPLLVCMNLGVCGSEELYMEASNAKTTQMLHHDVNSPSSSSIPALVCSHKRNSSLLAPMRTDGIRLFWTFLYLTQIHVSDCQNMSTIFPPNIQLNLPVLKELIVRACHDLTYIFSSAPNLRCLESLVIKHCRNLEVIVRDDVEEGGGRTNFVFSTLKDICLKSLPNLKGFCRGEFIFDWPLLTKLKISDCIKMKVFTLGQSTMPLLDHLFISSTHHNLAEEGGNIDTNLMIAIEKDLDYSNNVLREQCILTHVGFILASDHLISKCSSWTRKSRKEACVVREVFCCLERARPSNSRRPTFESEIHMDAEVTDKNDGVKHYKTHGPRKYKFLFNYHVDYEFTELWVVGYDLETATPLPFEFVLQHIYEPYPHVSGIQKPEFVGIDTSMMCLNLSENCSFIKDIFAREGLQPDFKNYFTTWLSALFPSIRFLDN